MREAFVVKTKSKTSTKRLSLCFVRRQAKEYTNGELSSPEPGYREVVVAYTTRHARQHKLGSRVLSIYMSQEKDVVRYFFNDVSRTVDMTRMRT